MKKLRHSYLNYLPAAPGGKLAMIIAKALNRPSDTVEKQLRKAKKMLIDHLQTTSSIRDKQVLN